MSEQFTAAIADFPPEQQLKARMSFIHADTLSKDEAINMCKWLMVRVLSQEIYYKQLIEHRWFCDNGGSVATPPNDGHIQA